MRNMKDPHDITVSPGDLVVAEHEHHNGWRIKPLTKGETWVVRHTHELYVVLQRKDGFALGLDLVTFNETFDLAD